MKRSSLQSSTIYIRRFYPEAIMIAELGENQDTPTKRINSWNKHMWGVTIPCRCCSNQFWSKKTYKTHVKSFHKK